MTLPPLHPGSALFPSGDDLPLIPACDHYAGNERFLRKALELQAELGPVFDITADCEDGAPRGGEREHLGMILDGITSPANRYRQVGVRIHDHSSPLWREEIEQVVGRAGGTVSHLTIPKVENPRHLEEMLAHLSECARRTSLSRSIPVHVLIESAVAVERVREIAAVPGIRGLDFGLMDFVSSHGGAIPIEGMQSPGQFTHHLIVRAKVEVAAAALAHRLIPAHNVTPSFADAARTAADARTARLEFGFLRMWSVHPVQVRAIVTAMQPDLSLVERAGAILLAARQVAWGPISHEGTLHDRASYRALWQLVQRARRGGMALPPAVERAFFSAD